jgi:ABC-type transport system involved in multi-copper enzyme maturation permease subunit
MTAIALRMSGADLLKLRRKRWLLWLSLFLTFGIVAIVYAVMAIEHASDPTKLGVQGGYGPAGGTASFKDGLRVLALFFGPLVAILIGIEAGTGDASAGVFRDLVVTGRSRLALFASRVPAALALCWAVMLVAYALLLLGTFLFAGNLATPDGALILNGAGFMLLSTGMLCVIAVGFASFTTSRAGAIVTLIAWQVVASPLIASISSLGSAREGILSQAILHFSPVSAEGRRGATVAMSQGTGLLVLVGWLAVFLALGAWRTRTMDA